MSLVGRTVGRYRITEKLGEGGMGVVYRAQDATLGRDVAIKVLRAEAGHHPERVRRFSQEARSASALNHPNIITVHDAGEFESGPFIVMELVKGESLRAQLRRGAMPLGKVLDIGIQAATALARAHDAGITHRDLKPENILMRSDGYVKILDFGLAKLKEQESSEEASTATIDAALTSEGTVVGTAAYMSPEQSTGRPVDGRSDIFSLALVLFECWQGRHPFLRQNSLDTRHAIAHDRLPALAYPPGTPEWGLARTLEKALEKEPEERYQTIKDLSIDLRRLKQDSESGKLPSSGAPASVPAGPETAPIRAGGTRTIGAAGRWRAGSFSMRSNPARPRVSSTRSSPTSPTPPLRRRSRRTAACWLSSGGRARSAVPGRFTSNFCPTGSRCNSRTTTDDTDGARSSRRTGRASHTRTHRRIGLGTPGSCPYLGGQPRLFLANAEGLTWIEAGAGPAPAPVFRTDRPGRTRWLSSPRQRAAPSSALSICRPRTAAWPTARISRPIGSRSSWLRWKLSSWLPCRLTPFDGSSPGKPVGPAPAQCTDAAWSPDGKWMYFSANTGSGYHIWRQRFPDGAPEQVTSGVDARRGNRIRSRRPLLRHFDRHEPEHGVVPRLARRSADHFGRVRSSSVRSLPMARSCITCCAPEEHGAIVSGELWVADLESGQRQRLLPDFLMQHYAISADGQRVVFVAADDAGRSPVWLAALDGRSAPRQVTAWRWPGRRSSARAANVIFVGQEKGNNFLYRVKEDGSELPKAVPTPLYMGRQLDFTGGASVFPRTGNG